MKIKDVMIIESAVQDRMYRSYAKHLVDQLVSEVKRNRLSGFRTGRMNASLFGEGSYGYSIEIASEVTFILIETDVMKDGDGGYDKNTKSIMLFVNDVDGIENRIGGGRYYTTLFHETIHFLDNVRMKEMPDAPDPNKYGYDKYHNSSVEMNAFYQEAMRYIDDLIEYNPEIINSLKSFDMFMRTVHYYMLKTNDQFYKSLTEKNKRRIMKRAYKHWLMVQGK